jgi:hypothetical protein
MSVTKPQNPQINWANPITKGLIFDAPFFEKATLKPRDVVVGNDSSTLTLGTGGYTIKTQGSAMSYDGTTTNLFWNTRLYQDSLTVYSYELFVYIIGTGGGGLGRLFVKGNGNAPGYIMANITATDLQFNIQAATTSGQWASAVPSSNVWHHIVFTLNEVAQPAKLYVDGNLQTLTTTTSSSGARQGESAHLYVGNTQSGIRGWNGYISYIRQYNRILIPNEIRSLAANPWQVYKQTKLGIPKR